MTWAGQLSSTFYELVGWRLSCESGREVTDGSITVQGDPWLAAAPGTGQGTCPP